MKQNKKESDQVSEFIVGSRSWHIAVIEQSLPWVKKVDIVTCWSYDHPIHITIKASVKWYWRLLFWRNWLEELANFFYVYERLEADYVYKIK